MVVRRAEYPGALCDPIFAVVAMLIGDRPKSILLAFLICYSIAAVGDGLVGVPWADLTTTSLDNRWRALHAGLTAAGTGVIMLLAAPLIGVLLGDTGPGVSHELCDPIWRVGPAVRHLDPAGPVLP